MSKLRCPHCSVSTAFSPVRLQGMGVLVNESSINKTVRATVTLWACTDEYEMGPESLSGQDFLYAILECLSCHKWYVANKEKYVGEWSAVYPIPHTPVADEIPEPIKSEFEEAYLCFAVGAYRGCLSMCEAALEAVWRKKEVSGLQGLKDKGIISERLYQQANEIRKWANVAKHEIIEDAVTKEEAEELLKYLEDLLDNIYIQPQRMSDLTQKRKQIEKST